MNEIPYQENIKDPLAKEPETLSREELEATLAVRSELGTEIEPALVDSLVDKIEDTVRRRFKAEYALEKQQSAKKPARGGQLALAIVSVVFGSLIATNLLAYSYGIIPLTIIWVGIIIINAIYGSYPFFRRDDKR